MAVIVEIAIDPVGTASTGVAEIILEAVKAIKKMGLKYQVCPMGTNFELKHVEELGPVISAVHRAVHNAGVNRIVTTIRIDDRYDKEETMEYKVNRVR